MSKNIAECHIIIYGSNCSVDQSFSVSVAPVNMQTIFQRHAANQFTGAAAISLAEGMDDVQLCHRLRQILNLLFFILFGKQLLGVNVFEHTLQFSVNQVWRVEHRVALADLLLADVPSKGVHIFKKEAVNPK